MTLDVISRKIKTMENNVFLVRSEAQSMAMFRAMTNVERKMKSLERTVESTELRYELYLALERIAVAQARMWNNRVNGKEN